MVDERTYLTNFSDLGLAEPILRAVTDEGYTTPTPIQTKAIPVSLTGKDILGIAQTGTGKTAAFVLPMLDRIARQGGKAAPKTCGALIMAPTRELVSQIADNIRNYSKFMRVSVTVIVGGVKPRPQINRLMAGTDIIVATPGRLLDHMNNGILRLDQTHTVVLDEADHMLDLGFIPDIRRIMKKLPKKRQTSLFSATMPTAIRSLANDFQTNPVEVSVAAASRPIERINQSVQHTPHAAKRDVLTQILSKEGVERAIVFTRTKRGADRVSMHLQKAGLSAAAIHGNKSQSQRVRALADFKAGQTNIMVATDIAARGIDIDDVSHVVNFELPEVAEAYVHRIGRTARAGREGIAISLCDPSEAKLLREIEKLIGSKLARDGVEAYSPGDAPVPDTAIKADPGVRGPKRKPRAYRGKGGGAGPNSGNGNTGKPANAKNRRRPSGKPNTGFGRPAGQAAGHRKGNRGGGAAAHA